MLQGGLQNAQDLAVHVVLSGAKKQEGANDPAEITDRRNSRSRFRIRRSDSGCSGRVHGLMANLAGADFRRHSLRSLLFPACFQSGGALVKSSLHINYSELPVFSFAMGRHRPQKADRMPGY